MCIRPLLLAFIFFFSAAHAATLDCPGAETLEALVDCISLQMPQDDDDDIDGFRPPDDVQMAALATAVREMLDGICEAPLPGALSGIMQRRIFVDASNQRPYCLLMEVKDVLVPADVVDRGWGTFIVYPDALRQISHQAPHPKFNLDTSGSAGDAHTEREAIRIFKASDSRSYLMCGARRSANNDASSCQSSYQAADCAHNIDNLVQIATQVMNEYYGQQEWTAIQWHAMGESCSSVEAYLKIGFATAPEANSNVTVMRQRFKALNSGYDVFVPGTGGSCNLNATDNTAGRLLNGANPATLCTSNAGITPSHKFMHIEQRVGALGNDLDGWAADWTDAVVHTFRTQAPGVATISATPGNGQVQLSWSAVSEATGYTLKRSTVSGGPYSTIFPAAGQNRADTTYTDTGRANGTTYYYVVSAVNNVAKVDSDEVGATPFIPLVVKPAMDANVRGGSYAGTTYNSSSLQAQTSSTASDKRQAFLKFPLTGAATISNAKLRLYTAASSSGSALAIEVREVVDTSWVESGSNDVNWNNKPPMGGVLGTASVSSSSASWREFDVTAYVQAAKAANATLISFGLASPTLSSSRHVTVRSRNHSTGSTRPQLVISP